MTNGSLVNKYLALLVHRQRGGSIDVVFRGARRWDSLPEGGAPDKFGGSFKDIARKVAPFLARGVSKFLLNTAGSFSRGDDLKDAAVGAIGPALLSAIGGEKKKKTKELPQDGQDGQGKLRKLLHRLKSSGMSTRAKRSKKGKKKSKRSKQSGQGIKAAKKTRKPKKARTVKKAKRSAKTVNF